MQYNILSTGSHGNAVIIENSILIDCGVPWKTIQPYARDLQLVLLTHAHQDHSKWSTIKRLAKERPMLRWGCCEWLVAPLVDCGVYKHNIDVYEYDHIYSYGSGMIRVLTSDFSVEPFPLFHDVPNCGYKLHINGEKLLYATDTNKILVEAKDFDLYMIEVNYDDEEIQQRIEKKILDGKEPIGEYRAMRNHLSQTDAMDFIVKNMGAHSLYIPLHGHVEKEDRQDAEI